jgi:hypothetical protein
VQGQSPSLSWCLFAMTFGALSSDRACVSRVVSLVGLRYKNIHFLIMHVWTVHSYVMFRHFYLIITHTWHLSAQNLSSMQYLSLHSMCSKVSLVIRTVIPLTRAKFHRCILCVGLRPAQILELFHSHDLL